MTGMNDLMDERIKERQERCNHDFEKIRDSKRRLFCSMCSKRLDE